MRTKVFFETGQTLVETVVGIFILTVGISTALGLAVSMYNVSSSAVKQVVAAGLAREGVEAIYNMRATNWLKGSTSANCYNYTDPSGTALCHADWLTGSGGTTYSLNPTGGPRSYVLDVNEDSTDAQAVWALSQQPVGNPQFRLYYDEDVSTGVLYKTTNASAVASDYYREIVLEVQPFVSTGGAALQNRLKVVSRVWWNDRGCPASATWPSSGKCRIELITYMTNWRNY
ncbi:MAG: hypothetical protein KBD66_02560 [Candidatus Doudnabacteria bacterium]|nr:hypothetical protein [Candidatus Doudnabacteria bacterium]